MNYTVDIIDTQDNTLVTSDEKAVASSIILDWKGGDQKDDLFIVGSSLSFTMVGMSMADGQYLDLFTGDETRFKVRLYDNNNTTIWTGFILPDGYSEPYSNSPILVDFEATDGLGRLKGKYLPEDFYEEEKSVIEIIAACLKLTGLNLSFRFAPAIENSQQKDYNKIYLDTALFSKNDKKQDAYKILDELLQSMLCTLYQADNYYNIEGLNVRNFRVYEAKIYSPSGTLTDTQEITRNRKLVTGLGKPDVTMQPPYGTVEISHKRENIKLPDVLSQEENDDWVIYNPEEGEIYATEWFGHHDFYAKAEAENYPVFIETGDIVNDYITLKEKPYLRKNKKYSLELNFDIAGDYEKTEIDNHVNAGDWTNPFEIEISILTETSKEVIFANYGVDTQGNRYIAQSFGTDQKKENKLNFIVNTSGLFDVKLSPVKTNTGINRIEISRFTLEEIDFSDTYTAIKELTQEYTIKKEIELPFADDYTALSKSFRLQKIREKVNYNEIQVTVKRTFYRDGFYYKTVDLKSANLIKDNIDSVYDAGQKVNVLDVIYNYQNSEEHVLKLEENLFFETITVEIYDYNSVTEDRTYWERWGDSIYKVELLRYPEIVCNIYNRLFDAPIPQFQNLQVKNNCKFNDFIDFPYREKDGWMLTNCRWNIDKGLSEVTAIQAYYNVNIGENLPPVVEAGDTVYFTGETAELTCEAYDPDGFIVSYEWREITAKGATITSPNTQNTGLTGLTRDSYEFEITVTDNQGATASDTVKVMRIEPHDLQFTEVEVDYQKEWHYTLKFSPNIPEGSVVNIQGTLSVMSEINNIGNYGGAAFRIRQNGYHIRNYEVGPDFGGGYEMESFSSPFSLQMTVGDEIVFELYVVAQVGDPNPDEAEARSTFTIDTLEFVEGEGTFTGIPVTIEKYQSTFL